MTKGDKIICKYCHKEFIADRDNRITCGSVKCSEKHQKEKNKEYRKLR